jgi:hypothetical protein
MEYIVLSILRDKDMAEMVHIYGWRYIGTLAWLDTAVFIFLYR